jgi:DNA-binding NarL/FixJ family response regulator
LRIEFAQRNLAKPEPSFTLKELTPRETEVLQLLAEGMSSPEIADRVVITEETIKTHVSRILTNYGCATAHRPSSAPASQDS